MGIGVLELTDTLGMSVPLSEVLGVQDAKIMKRKMVAFILMFCFAKRTSNGLRYWRWGGHGLCLGAEKTRSQPVWGSPGTLC